MPLLNDALYIEVIGGGAKGETIILRLPNGWWGVIDCFTSSLANPEENTVVRRLLELGVNELEFVALTHPHDDHYRGMSHVLSRFPPKRFWQFTGATQNYLNYLAIYLAEEADAAVPGTSPNSVDDLMKTFDIITERTHAKNIDFTYLSDTKELLKLQLIIDGTNVGLSLRSIAPDSTVVRDYESDLAKCFKGNALKPTLIDLDHNRLSAGFIMEFGTTRVVLGGDIVKETWSRIIGRVVEEGSDISAHAVKVSHHGSMNGYCEGMWTRLAHCCHPVAVITPYQRSDLPAVEAISHIMEYADSIVQTSLRPESNIELSGVSFRSFAIVMCPRQPHRTRASPIRHPSRHGTRRF